MFSGTGNDLKVTFVANRSLRFFAALLFHSGLRLRMTSFSVVPRERQQLKNSFHTLSFIPYSYEKIANSSCLCYVFEQLERIIFPNN